MSLKERAREAQESTRSWYEQLNHELQEAEAVFASMNLPTNFGITIKSVEHEWGPQVTTIDHCLWYMKHDNRWCFCYQWVRDGDPEDATTKPVLECTAQERIDALRSVPQLLERAVQEAERVASQIEQALGAAREALAPFKTIPS
jgi:hypothetical protein